MVAAVETMAYVEARGVPWHRDGVPADGLMTAAEVLDKAGLLWTVEQKPLYIEKPGGRGATQLVTTHRANVRSTDNAVLGVVGSRFTPVQNADSLSCLDAIVDDGGAKYDTAGSLLEGKRVFMSMILPTHMEVKGDSSPYEHYLVAINGHDGGQAFQVIRTTVRVVCMNTLQAAQQSALAKFSARHTSGVTGKVGEIRDALSLTFKELETFEQLANKMARLRISEARAKEVLLKVFPIKQASKADADLAASDFAGALANWKGTETIDDKLRGTHWGLYNAIVEYADYGITFRKADNRVAELMTGTGRTGRPKAVALSLLS